MMWLNSNIGNHLTCSICEQEYKDPRVVPCGKSFCKKCIESLSDTNHSTFKCLCAKKHVIPEDGEFPVNDLLDLLLKDAVKMSPVQLSADSTKKLSDVKQKMNKLNFGINSSRDAIYGYIEKIRVKIDLTTETIIQNIQNQRDKLLLELKEKEESYIKSLDENSKIKQDISEWVKELEKQCNDFEKKIKYLGMDEKEISTSSSKLLLDITKCQLELDKYLYNKERLNFEIDSKSQESLSLNIGKIDCKPSELIIDFGKLRQYELKEASVLHADFDYYSDGNIFMCYSTSIKHIELGILDKESKIIVKKRLNIVSVNISSLKCYIHPSDKFAILLINKSNKTSDIKIINPKSLEVISSTTYNLEAVNIHLNTKYIYVSFKSDKTRIFTYDSNLKKQSKILSTINSSSDCFQMDDERLFWTKDDSRISIYNNLGKKLDSILVVGKLCSIFNNSYIVTYDSNDKSLYYYNFDGSYAGNQKIPDHILSPSIVKCKNDMILLFDHQSSKLYFSQKI